MKAYMSTSETKERRDLFAASALAEAEWILRQTEAAAGPWPDAPTVDRTEHGSIYGGARVLAHRTLYGETRRALAESLATVVADGGPLDELAAAALSAGSVAVV